MNPHRHLPPLPAPLYYRRIYPRPWIAVRTRPCPWPLCTSGFFFPRPSVQLASTAIEYVFPALAMKCSVGVRIACPYCHGYQFALDDHRRVRKLYFERDAMEIEEARRWDRYRRRLMDAQRRELGLGEVRWGRWRVEDGMTDVIEEEEEETESEYESCESDGSGDGSGESGKEG